MLKFGTGRSRRLRTLLGWLERLPKIPETEHLREYRRSEYKAFVGSFVELIGRSYDVNRLERSLTAASNVDFDLLDEAAKRLATLPLSSWSYTFPNGRKVEPAHVLDDLKRVLAATRSVSEKAPLLEVMFRLELAGDRYFDNIMQGAAGHEEARPVTEWLIEQVRKKLDMLDDADVARLWRELRKEFEVDDDDDDEIPSARMRPVPGIVEPSFLEQSSMDEARQKIATYVCEIRPKLLRALTDKGQTHFAIALLGMARLLGLAANATVLGTDDGVVAEALVRIFAVYSASLGGAVEDLRAALGLPTMGRLSEGPVFAEQAKHLEKATIEDRLVVLRLEASKILDVLLSDAEEPSMMEELLLRHKLALEVMAPEIISVAKKKGEILLQKELCRFLVEHGIKAVGTRFGRAETDVVVQETAGAIVVEVKKVTRIPSTRQIRRWLVQLQAYMDQEPMQVRGALVIYNFTSAHVVAPKNRIRDRYWIVPLNLVHASPSRGTSSLEIIEAQEGKELIDVIRQNAPGASNRGHRRPPDKPTGRRAKAPTRKSGRAS